MGYRDKLKSWVEESPHTMKSASLAAGLSETMVREIIVGRIKNPGVETLEAIAGVFGRTIEELYGDIDNLPLAQEIYGDGAQAIEPAQRISVPGDAAGPDGLSAYRMADDSMATEIPKGTIMIAADPDVHMFPMVPGMIYIIRRRGALLVRKHVVGPDGNSWLVTCPEEGAQTFPGYVLENDADNDGKAAASSDGVRMTDIVGGVLWEYRARKH